MIYPDLIICQTHWLATDPFYCFLFSNLYLGRFPHQKKHVMGILVACGVDPKSYQSSTQSTPRQAVLGDEVGDDGFDSSGEGKAPSTPQQWHRLGPDQYTPANTPVQKRGKKNRPLNWKVQWFLGKVLSQNYLLPSLKIVCRGKLASSFREGRPFFLGLFLDSY